MRIWAFPSVYPIDRPGRKWYGIFAHRQYKGLISNGAELQVIQPVYWAPPLPFSHLDAKWKLYRNLNYPNFRRYDGIDVHHPRIQNYKPSRFFKPLNERVNDSIIGFFKNNNIILDPKRDIFLSQWIPEAGFAQHAAHILGIKSAVMVIGDDVLVEPHKKKDAMDNFIQVWRDADIRLTVADYLGKEANSLTGEALSYEVIRRGVNYDQFLPLALKEKIEFKKQFNIPENKIAIAVIGSPIVRKGWIDLFDALKLVKPIFNDFVIVAVYAGAGNINIVQEITDRQLEENFVDIGELEPAKVNGLLNAADIFCLPSHWEGIANAVVEAMSCGIPVITTNVCGHPELIKDGETGILIPPKSPEILFEKLLLLFQNRDLRQTLGSNARDFIVNQWGSFSDNSKKLYHVLQQCIDM